MFEYIYEYLKYILDSSLSLSNHIQITSKYDPLSVTAVYAASKHFSTTPILLPYFKSPLFLIWTIILASLLFSPFRELVSSPSTHVLFKT